MVFKLLSLSLIFLFSFQSKASAHLGCREPTVMVTLHKVNPTYVNDSVCGDHSGCTESYINIFPVIHLNKNGCMQLDFNAYLGAKEVHINEKYTPDSCEYEIIKEHENSHVFAIQDFSEKQIKNSLLQCITEEINKKNLKKGEEIYSKCAQITKDWIQKTINERNKLIDKNHDDFGIISCKRVKEMKKNLEKRLLLSK